MRILVLDERDGYRYFRGSTPRQLHRSALKIVKERFARGTYDDEYEAREQAREIVETDDGAWAWRFLKSRTKVDYEHVNVVELEE